MQEQKGGFNTLDQNIPDKNSSSGEHNAVISTA